MSFIKFRIFLPLPPFTPIKYTQPPILRPLFHDSPSPSDADIISGGPLMSLEPFLADEFCDSYPHHIHPTPGYWIECARAISNRGSAWTNSDNAGGGDDDLAEVDEGITNSPDGSLRFWDIHR